MQDALLPPFTRAITYLIPVPNAIGVRESFESVSITWRNRKQTMISCRTEAIKHFVLYYLIISNTISHRMI